MTVKDRTFPDALRARRPSAIRLYLRSFLAHPDRLASIAPSSATLGRLVAEQVRRSGNEFVVELGPGTGAITAALLRAGVPAERLIAVEIDDHMADFLRTVYPDITVIQGDAFRLEQILPVSVIGKVGTVVCGLPASLLPAERQRELARVMFSLMPAGRRFLAYSYRVASPFQEGPAGIAGTRVAFTLRNLPPASVWAYEPAASG